MVRPIAAAPPQFVLPIDCAPGQDCWPVRYLDHEPGPGALDYRCGPQSGDGHQGTDIAIRDLAAMTDGVAVLAAAAGTVIGIRDGEPDVSVERRGREALGGRECGNGVRLDHGGGWTSQVCHLRRGSVSVVEGDRVAAGDRLGLVGLSGETTFPHLHFSVKRDGVEIDPFVGLAPAKRCGLGAEPLWSSVVLEALAYRPVVVHSAGFASAVPDPDDLRRGWHHQTELPVTSPALVFWIDGFWVHTGDRAQFRLSGPGGEALVDNQQVIEDDHRRWFGYAGRKRPAGKWLPGRYVGEFLLERDSASGRPVRASLRREVVLR